MDAANIPELERLLLPAGCHFADDAKDVINCWESANVMACPGSGKTTVLMAKLQHLADRMPLPRGRGICILSHTNVAVDEIKKRLTRGAAEKILGYPNYAGTIQSFVDSFIVFPFLRSKLRSPIHLVSREDFAKAVWNRVGSSKTYLGLKAFISNKYNACRAWCESEVKLIEGWSVDGRGNLSSGKRVLAASTTSSAKAFNRLIKELLVKDGLISYDFAYDCARNIVGLHGDLIRPVISSRFQFIFIDEYQDCSDVQRSLIANLFDGTDTVVQRIGDADQAIYNSIYTSMADEWNAFGRCHEIAETNRYGEEIARVVSMLRSGQKNIVSQRGALNRKPVLFVYQTGAEKQLVGAFVAEIRKENLNPHGVFKAIGMVARGTGTTILDYWESFADDVALVDKGGWAYYRQEVVRQLSIGRLYKVALMMVEMLVLISRCCGIRTEGGGFYTKTRVRKIVAEKADGSFREGILRLALAFASDSKRIEHHILALLISLCQNVFGGEWTEEGLLRELSADKEGESRRQPIPCLYDDGITVCLSTIHGVKGETHDATLYLETDHRGSSDLKRIMPLFVGRPLKEQEVVERTRRCAYVGMSRPRHLLCVAMKADTYEGHSAAFESEWNVVEIHKS